jgi:hypothetical protein
LKGLYNITRAASEELASQELGHALVLVHADRWFQYASLLPLVRPFAESDLRIAWGTNARVEAELVASAGERSIYIYDAVRGELNPLVKVP